VDPIFSHHHQRDRPKMDDGGFRIFGGSIIDFDDFHFCLRIGEVVLVLLFHSRDLETYSCFSNHDLSRVTLIEKQTKSFQSFTVVFERFVGSLLFLERETCSAFVRCGLLPSFLARF